MGVQVFHCWFLQRCQNRVGDKFSVDRTAFTQIDCQPSMMLVCVCGCQSFNESFVSCLSASRRWCCSSKIHPMCASSDIKLLQAWICLVFSWSHPTMVWYNILNMDVLVHIEMQIYEYAYLSPSPSPHQHSLHGSPSIMTHDYIDLYSM